MKIMLQRGSPTEQLNKPFLCYKSRGISSIGMRLFLYFPQGERLEFAVGKFQHRLYRKRQPTRGLTTHDYSFVGFFMD